MWSQPATARQISALKAHGNFDGKFYSKGRAGQAIGESVRAAGSAASTPRPHTGSSHAGRSQQPTPTHSSIPVTGPAPIPLDPAPLLGEIVAPTPATLPAQLAAAPTGGHPGEQRSRCLSFALFDELEERHLREFQNVHGWGRGDSLRNEVKAWAQLRIKLARKLADAHVELVAILREAPAGALPDPTARASDLLAAATPHELEERHLREYQREHGWGRGDGLRNEVKAWVNSRIELARTNARAVVDLLDAQAALAPVAQPAAQPAALPAAPGPATAQATGRGEQRPRPKTPGHPRPGTVPATRSGKGRTYLATVVRINAHGAVVSLDSGEQGWLHVSQLRGLNGGAHLESVSDVLKIGQQLRTRGIGTTDRDEVRLALVGAEAAKQDGSDGPAAAPESADAATPPASVKRRGFFGRLGLGRSTKEQP